MKLKYKIAIYFAVVATLLISIVSSLFYFFSVKQINRQMLAVAAKEQEHQEYLKNLEHIILIALVVTIFISFIIGLLFSKSLITPLRSITGELNLITSSNLSQRLNTSDSNEELNKLSHTLNNLLDRLNESFAIQRRFISNASHELSTPLTSISSQLEVALQKERTPEEYREVMTSIFEDITELQHLTKSLLDIAKAGSHGSIDLSEIRLDEVLIKVTSDIKKQNSSYRTDLNFEELPEDDQYLTVFGNPDLLYIALKNIIENGCKYSDDQQSNVGILITHKDVIIHVANKGDVIAEADIQNIFQPFFRTDSALGKPGFGLGLTLTRRILSLHNGSITVESSIEKGTIFTIQLPNIISTV